MDMLIEKQTIFDIPKITALKSQICRVKSFKKVGELISGTLGLDITFFNQNMEEIYVPLETEFEIVTDSDVNIINIELGRTNADVIDGQGIALNFELKLVVGSMNSDEKVEEIPIINVLEEKEEVEEVEEDTHTNEEFCGQEKDTNENDNQKTSLEELTNKEQIENQKAKDTIHENYDSLLEKSLEERDKNTDDNRNVRILSTKDEKSEFDFLSFFDLKEQGYYKVKCLNVYDEVDLNKISKEYNVSLDTLYKGYDREHNKVIFSCK